MGHNWILSLYGPLPKRRMGAMCDVRLHAKATAVVSDVIVTAS
jgi:hypothetical protein